MADTFELGRATGLLADAVGPPGQRQFRILARNDFELANLLVERQHLQAMAEAISQLLAEYRLETPEDPDRPPREGPLEFNLRPNISFRVGELGIGFDEPHKLFVVVAKDIEAAQDGPPTFTCLVSREQLQAFGFAVHALMASGRERCPICGRPLEGGPHDHAQSNGHNKGE